MAIAYPASYNTSSSINTDLTGSMVLSDAETVQSYKSTAQGDATDIKNNGGTGLSFKLEFNSGALKYHVNASEEDNGEKYQGDSGKDSPEAGVDDWEAISIPPEPKGY